MTRPCTFSNFDLLLVPVSDFIGAFSALGFLSREGFRGLPALGSELPSELTGREPIQQAIRGLGNRT